MTTTTGAGKAGLGPAGGAGGWFALAAAPTFGLMGLIAAHDASSGAICLSTPSLLPVDGMTTMYLLMSLFHLPPWLKLARRAGA